MVVRCAILTFSGEWGKKNRERTQVQDDSLACLLCNNPERLELARLSSMGSANILKFWSALGEEEKNKKQQTQRCKRWNTCGCAFFFSRNYTLVSIWHVWSGPARAAAGCFFLFLPGRVSSICVSVKQMMILHQLIRSQTRQPAKIVIPHGTPQGLGSKSMQGPGPGVYVCVCFKENQWRHLLANTARRW